MSGYSTGRCGVAAHAGARCVDFVARSMTQLFRLDSVSIRFWSAGKMDVFHRNLRSRKNVLGFTTDMSTEVDHGSTSDLLLLAERSVLHMLFLFFFSARDLGLRSVGRCGFARGVPAGLV